MYAVVYSSQVLSQVRWRQTILDILPSAGQIALYGGKNEVIKRRNQVKLSEDGVIW